MGESNAAAAFDLSNYAHVSTGRAPRAFIIYGRQVCGLCPKRNLRVPNRPFCYLLGYPFLQ